MGEYRATIEWKSGGRPRRLREGQVLARAHVGVRRRRSRSPHRPRRQVVPPPWSNPANVDPEEAFVAAIASCHMLTFLYLAAKAGFAVASYRDEAVGVMTKNERGMPWVAKSRSRR